MKVIILTRENQKKILEKAARFSCNSKCSFLLFTSVFELKKNCCQKNSNVPFLILADSSFFQSDAVNPYTAFSFNEKIIPLCLYNDPFPKKTKRAAFWLSKIYAYCAASLESWKFQEISEIFLKLEYFFRNPKVENQISVICSPYGKLKKIRESKKFDMLQNDLCTSRFKLLEFFMKHFEKEVSAGEIMDFMWKDSVGQKIDSLYAYINDLRKFLKRSGYIGFELIHTAKGKYMMHHENLA